MTEAADMRFDSISKLKRKNITNGEQKQLEQKKKIENYMRKTISTFVHTQKYTFFCPNQSFADFGLDFDCVCKCFDIFCFHFFFVFAVNFLATNSINRIKTVLFSA